MQKSGHYEKNEGDVANIFYFFHDVTDYSGILRRLQIHALQVKLLLMLTEEQVRHIAKLARISLTEEEVKKFTVQIGGVLEYVDILQEVDTEGVPETSQVTGLTNVMEEDVIVPSQSSREELLGCSELPVESHQIRVPRVVK